MAQATVHYIFGTKEGLYRAVMEQLTQDLIAQVERAAPTDAGFEQTVGALAAALWHTVREQPASHQLLTELSHFALRTPALNEALESHYRRVTEVTARLVSEAAERTGQPSPSRRKRLRVSSSPDSTGSRCNISHSPTKRPSTPASKPSCPPWWPWRRSTGAGVRTGELTTGAHAQLPYYSTTRTPAPPYADVKKLLITDSIAGARRGEPRDVTAAHVDLPAGPGRLTVAEVIVEQARPPGRGSSGRSRT